MSKRIPLLAVPGLVALLSQANGAIVTNSLLVDLDAAAWGGSGGWNNAGSLGGAFTPDGTPTKATANGVNGVYFDGTDAFVGPASPAGITGTGDRSVEVWVYQGAVNGEETLLAWGKRGGGDGTNNSVNWGSDGTFGAFGGWGGGPDQGYGTLAPTKGQWNHIAMTVNSAGDKSIYVNGALATFEAAATNGPALNTHAALDILLGAQQNGTAAPGATVVDGGNKLQGGVIGRVRINDGELSAADILNNYNEEKATFQLAAAPAAALSAGPAHRWSFNETSGTSFADTGSAASVGSAAQLKGAGAVLTGAGVDLPGGASATQAYIDLPNGVASGKDVGAGYGSVSYEVFVTVSSSQAWSRILDFGTGSAGEVNDAGGAFNGTSYILLSNNIGGAADMRMERLAGASPGTRDAIGATILGAEQHLVMTYDAADGMWKWYQNGKLMEGFASDAPSNLDDVNNWLGRSNWAGDANTDGTYDEFRIYDYALSAEQIQQNFLDGANKLTIVPEPSAALLGLAGLGLLTRRRRQA